MKKKFSFLITIAALVGFYSAFAHPGPINGGGTPFTKTFGGDEFDEADAIEKVSSGGYIIAGRSSSYSHGNTDLNLIRIDESGAVIWNKTYGGEFTEVAYAVTETSDGGFIAAGYSDSYGKGEGIKDIWVLKVSGTGEAVWNKTFGSENSLDEAKAITKTEEGNYIIIGSSYVYSPEEVPSDIIAIKIDPQGNKLWEKKYGGQHNEEGADICATSDGYTIVGSTESFGKGKWDIWVVHIDKNGKKLWDNTYGGGDNEMGNSIYHTADQGYVIGGYTYSFAVKASHDFWVIKADNTGKKQWAKAFGE